jgi:hypothetical protein
MTRVPKRIVSKQRRPGADEPPRASEALPLDRMTEADLEAVNKACEIFGCGLSGLR